MRSWSFSRNIAFEKAENMVGRELLAMVEGKVSDESAYVARTYGDAPGMWTGICLSTQLRHWFPATLPV